MPVILRQPVLKTPKIDSPERTGLAESREGAGKRESFTNMLSSFLKAVFSTFFLKHVISGGNKLGGMSFMLYKFGGGDVYYARQVIVVTSFLFYFAGMRVQSDPNGLPGRGTGSNCFAPKSPSRPLLLDRVVFDVPSKGTVLGERRQGNLCVFPAPLIWGDEVLEYNRGDYHREFEKIANHYNFELVKKSTSLFGTSIPTGNELLIAARIVVTNQNLCSARTFSEHIPIRKGNVRLSVRWEIFSVAEKKVVYVLENESSGVLEDFKPDGEDSYYVQAFGNSVRGLLNDRGFRTLVSSVPHVIKGTV